MRRHRVVAANLAAWLLAGGCQGDGAAKPDEPAPSTTQVAAAELVERACDTAADLPPTECYWLEVPERRDRAGARTIRLWVAVIRPDSSSAMPLIELTGGPGNTASNRWVDGGVNLDGYGESTIVVLDQRGTGRSEPRVECPPPAKPDVTTDPPAVRIEADRAAIAACRRALTDAGIDLNGYDTVESARDVVELRRALAYDRVVVGGFSYGGRLAQEVYRQDPGGVAGLVLDSTLSTAPFTLDAVIDHAEAAVAHITAACAAVATCATIGDFDANLDRAAAALDAEPYVVAGSEQVVDGQVLRWGVFQALYDADLAGATPQFVAAIAEGNRAILDAVAAQLLPGPEGEVPSTSDAIFDVVSCADNAETDPEQERAVLDGSGPWFQLAFGWAHHCDLWDVDPVQPGGLAPVVGDVPVLAVAGGLDPVHPVADTRATTAELSNTTVVVVPSGGHGNARANECTRQIAVAFLASPGQELDTGCVSALAAPFAP